MSSTEAVKSVTDDIQAMTTSAGTQTRQKVEASAYKV